MIYKKISINDEWFYIYKTDKGYRRLDMTSNNNYQERMAKPLIYSDYGFEDFEKQLTEYLSGQRTVFDLPLDLGGTAFQNQVWALIRTIPYGEVINYEQLSEKLGNKNKVRAVASATAKTPVPIVIPCHRIIGKDGKLHGYRFGLKLKKQLLTLENNNH